MVTVMLDGRPFNFIDEGSGEPVVHILGSESRWMIKGGVRDSSGIPRLTKIKSLTGKYRVLAYDNYNLNTEYNVANDPFGHMVTKPITSDRVKQVSEDCYVFMRALNIGNAHIFAHSNVGFVGLKLALDHPELVNSIALLEFELVSSSLLERKAMEFGQKMIQKASAYAAANPEKIKEILAKVNYSGTLNSPSGETPESLSRKYPSSFAEPKNPEEFQMRMQIMGSLGLPMEEIQKQLKQPILSITWDYSVAPFKKSSELMKSWLPQTESFTVPKREHWYQENMDGFATGLMDFFSRHPIP